MKPQPHRNPCNPRTLRQTAAASLLAALALAASPTMAQMKVGKDPATLAPGANLQVQADNDAQFYIRKSDGNVGVGTTSPGNLLHVDSGTNNASGVRVSRIPNAQLLGTNAQGDIVPVDTSVAACTCGDIKAGLQTANHGSWRLMNGQSYPSNTCGLSGAIPNAAGRVLVQGGAPGTISNATGITLARNNLPNVSISGSTSIAGAHSHTYSFVQDGIDAGYGWLANNDARIVNRTTTENGNHSHTFSFNLNGDVQQAQINLSTNNLPRLSVNHFVCVN